MGANLRREKYCSELRTTTSLLIFRHMHAHVLTYIQVIRGDLNLGASNATSSSDNLLHVRRYMCTPMQDFKTKHAKTIRTRVGK